MATDTFSVARCAQVRAEHKKLVELHRALCASIRASIAERQQMLLDYKTVCCESRAYIAHSQAKLGAVSLLTP